MPKASITTRHLEIFLTMILSRNMAEAADKLGVSMAAVSKSLRGLERETGLKLFRNVNGRLSATPEADRLLPFAQRAVDHLDRARDAARALGGGDLGRIVVATAGPALVSVLPLAIKEFHMRWPEVRIEIEIDTTRHLLEKVAGNEVDLGVGTPIVRDLDARLAQLCVTRDLCETALVAVLPERHPLARRDSIRARDLANESLIGLAGTSATTQLIGAAFQQAGVPYITPIVAANAIGVCGLVQQEVGIGLMNALMLTQDIFPGVVVRRFRPRIALRTCLYYSKVQTPSQAMLQFIDCVSRTAKALATRLKSRT
ncbi:MAG: LysR family transcriptional regulator [Proteobacteria bacterium]|nr:LysR family transcriptional regulator [Pseudomonadota bacterium]